jgi:hypothetical protein
MKYYSLLEIKLFLYKVKPEFIFIIIFSNIDHPGLCQ